MKPKFMLAVVAAAVALGAFSAGASGTGQSGQENKFTAQDIINRNIQAAGGAAAIARIRNLSFKVGIKTYTVATDGRMKIRSAVQDPAVYETIVADGKTVQLNSVNRLSQVEGVERGQWLCLSRLYSGLFTLKNFLGLFTYVGMKTYGPERHYVLSTSSDGLQAVFHIDASDFLVRRMILSGKDTDGAAWERIYEIGNAEAKEGVMIPWAVYMTQVGIGETYLPAARPMTGLKFNEDLPEGFFSDLAVNTGKAAAAPGRIEGTVLAALFGDDFFVWIFTNWTEEEIRTAGFRNGETVVLTSGGAEFESRFYSTEDKVDDPTVYAPGNSLFIHNPSLCPLFYAQFNTLAPKERFEDLKARVKLLAPIQARKK